jgi:hypothetical protein
VSGYVLYIAVLLYRKFLTSLPHWVIIFLRFGLQIGWAIEGAIGSIFKIDASYLSPHVNMVSTLANKKKLSKDISHQIINSYRHLV